MPPAPNAPVLAGRDEANAAAMAAASRFGGAGRPPPVSDEMLGVVDASDGVGATGSEKAPPHGSLSVEGRAGAAGGFAAAVEAACCWLLGVKLDAPQLPPGVKEAPTLRSDAPAQRLPPGCTEGS